jgi:hypothetical protein
MIKTFHQFRIEESLSSARNKFLKTGAIGQGTFDTLRSFDPTSTNKYLDKIIEFYLKDRPNAAELKTAMERFHQLSSRNQIERKDINAYTSYRSKLRKKDADIVYQDNRYLVVIPRTHEASCKYGTGTKWCTNSEDPDSYDSYVAKGATLYYILDSRETIANSLYKIGVIVHANGNIECVDARDNDIEFEDVIYFTGLDPSLFIPRNK